MGYSVEVLLQLVDRSDNDHEVKRWLHGHLMPNQEIYAPLKAGE